MKPDQCSSLNNCVIKVQFHLFIETSAGQQPAPDDNEYPLPEQQPATVEATSAEVEGSKETSDTTGNTYGLLTKREVKMAGYWPSSFFACLWTETKSRSINTQKKNEANILPS